MGAEGIDRVAEGLRAAVSAERLQEHLDRFSTLFRDSGTEDERRAAEYIRDRMTEYGVQAEILEFDSLISWPREGTLTVLDDDGNAAEEIAVRTRSFGTKTPDGGIEGELVFVPFEQPEAGAMIFSHRAVAGDYSGLDVRGKIVLTMDGGPDGIRRAQERGAAGHIHIWPSDEAVVHEMIGTSVWGTPTPESALRLPTIPVLGVEQRRRRAAGGALPGRDGAGADDVRRPYRLDAAAAGRRRYRGRDAGSDDRFLLVGAHIDSWYEGITDNATGDAALIEMARVLHEQRGELRHGVRFAWWPGHSTGRYSGSTWYADTHFMELRERCLGYLNIDSPGVRETEIWDCRYNMGEIEHITSRGRQAALRAGAEHPPPAEGGRPVVPRRWPAEHGRVPDAAAGPPGPQGGRRLRRRLLVALAGGHARQGRRRTSWPKTRASTSRSPRGCACRRRTRTTSSRAPTTS